MPEDDLSRVISRLGENPNDQTAWQDLYVLLWPFVLTVNQRLLRSAWMAAEDISQEVFLRLAKYCSFNKFTDSSSFKSYVRAISRNVCSDYIRMLIKTSEVPLDLAPQQDSEGEAAGILTAKEDLSALSGGLVDSDRRLLASLLSGLKINEIATIEGISYGNAAVKLHRLRQRIKRLKKDLSAVKTSPRERFKKVENED